jgi:hypothetical protein
MQNQEKRRTGRLALSVAIEAFSGSFPIGMLRNLGPEGMFIQSTEPKEVGTQMDLSLTLPKGHRKILLTGEPEKARRPNPERIAGALHEGKRRGRRFLLRRSFEPSSSSVERDSWIPLP